jgi:pimeloyl-ACP methyl ester carboxylesterase
MQNIELEVITKGPSGSPRPTPLVFIHGGWHGAWCWELFQQYFAEQGYRSHALSLRGHGASSGRERLRCSSAAEYLADLDQVIRQMPAPPVLIGHSMGGYLIQKYLESRTARAAVLLASIPARGLFMILHRLSLRHPLQTIKMHAAWEPFALIETPDLAREAFFSADIAPAKLDRYVSLLQPESYRVGWDASVFKIPRPRRVRKVPMLVLGAEKDTLITTDEVRATAAAYGTRAELYPDMAHDMMLENGWQSVAARMAEWLREKGF